MFATRTTAKQAFRPAFDRLENRDTPAMIYGWHNGSMMFFDNGIAASDIQQVQVPAQLQAPAVTQVAKVILNNVTHPTADTVAFNVQIQGALPGIGLEVNAARGASLVSITNVQQSQLIGVQQGSGAATGNSALDNQPNAAVAAWAAISPGSTWTPDATSQMTLTYSVNGGVNASPFSVGFTGLPAGWTAVVDTTALDAFFAQGNF